MKNLKKILICLMVLFSLLPTLPISAEENDNAIQPKGYSLSISFGINYGVATQINTPHLGTNYLYCVYECKDAHGNVYTQSDSATTYNSPTVVCRINAINAGYRSYYMEATGYVDGLYAGHTSRAY